MKKSNIVTNCLGVISKTIYYITAIVMVVIFVRGIQAMSNGFAVSLLSGTTIKFGLSGMCSSILWESMIIVFWIMRWKYGIINTLIVINFIYHLFAKLNLTKKCYWFDVIVKIVLIMIMVICIMVLIVESNG